MIKILCGAMLAIVLTVFFSASAFTQDAAKKEPAQESMKKAESTKADMDKEMATGPLKSVTCDPKCGFMVRSRNEKEIISVIKAHAKKMHKMTMTDKQVKDMIKVEEGTDTGQ